MKIESNYWLTFCFWKEKLFCFKKQKREIIFNSLCLLFLHSFIAFSKESPPVFIRDAEIEEGIRALMIPLLKTAELSIQSFRLFIVQCADVNAAAGSGVTLFLNSGLIEQVKDVRQLIGVLAHETGHMAGGHVARFDESYQNSTMMVFALSLLGLATGILTNQSDLAIASALGGQHVAMQSLLHYSRAQESSADQAGAAYLKVLNWPISGGVEFLEYLQGKENDAPHAYYQTHPLTKERINALKHLVYEPEGTVPVVFEQRFQRMKAKILAYTLPKRALKLYKGKTPLDLYSQSIAYFRIGNLKESLALIDKLLMLFPTDPYFYELKGQIFQHSSHIKEAIDCYKKAIEFLPENGLLRIDLGRLLLSLNTISADKEAFIQFEQAKKTQEIDNPFLWKQLSIVYRRQHNPGMSSLCLAQESVLQNNKEKAYYHADQALKHFKKSEPGYLKALDIKNTEF